MNSITRKWQYYSYKEIENNVEKNGKCKKLSTENCFWQCRKSNILHTNLRQCTVYFTVSLNGFVPENHPEIQKINQSIQMEEILIRRLNEKQVLTILKLPPG